MATLTGNVFWGQGETEHRLDVVEGNWPTDMDGSVFVVGPDKREPGGHWFDAPGLLCRIRVRPDAKGCIEVSHRRIDTPIDRIRRRLPWLFGKVAFMELSPFGLSNLANTNVEAIGDRLFVGYDAGRPIEVDPETMKFCTPVGANDEWFQASPGLYEPGISVAAHPGADHEAGRLYFVNYSPLPFCDDVFLAEWDLEGPISRWRIEGMSDVDSIHDVKVTRDHIVFSDLPFVVEPETFRGLPQPRPNGDTTTLRIVARRDLERTTPGGSVPCREVVIPIPTGHLSVDYEETEGRIRVFLEHIPLQDLMITLDRDTVGHFTGELMDPNHAGLVTLSVQPGLVGSLRDRRRHRRARARRTPCGTTGCGARCSPPGTRRPRGPGRAKASSGTPPSATTLRSSPSAGGSSTARPACAGSSIRPTSPTRSCPPHWRGSIVRP